MIDRPDDNHYGGDDDDAEDEKVNEVMMTMNNEIIIKMTGETPAVRFDKKKPRMLLRHRTP